MNGAAPLRVAMLSTFAPGSRGSMARYARLAAAAARSAGCQVREVGLAPRLPRAWPPALRTWVAHAAIATRVHRGSAQLEADIVHLLDGSAAYCLPRLRARRLVATIHDCIPALQVRGRLGPARPSRPARWLTRRGLRDLAAADHIIADSRCTESDLRSCGVGGSSCSVVYPALDPELVPRGDSGSRLESGLVLHVGGSGFYKNRKQVFRVFRRVACLLGQPLELVLAGAPVTRGERQAGGAAGLDGRWRQVAEPSEEELSRLYESAALLLFPSLYEGFGWPPLEAMAHGCPVVCSHAGSLQEVVGDAALLAGPEDSETLAAHCCRLLTDAALRQEMVRRGRLRAARFTLEQMERGLMAAYRCAMA